MRRTVLVGAIFVAACKPDLGPPASLITGTRLLAVRATPPEVRPGTPDSGVVYQLLAVTPAGDVPAPQIEWSFCVAPTPPAENNLVSSECLGPNAQLEAIASLGPDGGPDGTASVPDDACSVFGPFPPARTDAGAGRPPDPDGTGGYYQPVRVDLELGKLGKLGDGGTGPGKLGDGGTGPGEPGDGILTTFGEERIQCGLPNVTVDVANGFKAYTLNQNPVLDGVAASVNGGVTQPLEGSDAGAGLPIPAGATVTFAASWPAESAESFPVFDQQSRTLVTQRENLITSWFVTAGAMALDEVEVAGTDSSTSASNQWTAPATAGTVHLWVVLRDSRGGVDFGEFLLDVQ
jgi:hypothetical protein